MVYCLQVQNHIAVINASWLCHGPILDDPFYYLFFHRSFAARFHAT